jgi:hypothetical protein
VLELPGLWYSSVADAERGIVGIMIPRQPADRWPIIVTKVVDEAATPSGSWIAYFERRGEHAVPLTPADLQRLLRDGQRTDALPQRLDVIDDQLRALQNRQPAPPPPAGPSQALQSYRQRRNAAMTVAGLNAVPVFALTAAPVETISRCRRSSEGLTIPWSNSLRIRRDSAPGVLTCRRAIRKLWRGNSGGRSSQTACSWSAGATGRSSS